MDGIDIKPPRIKSRLRPVKVDSAKRIIPRGDSRKPTYWRVNVGKRYTGTVKMRKFFATEREALDFIAETESALKVRGHSAFDIPHALAAEAMKLVKELEVHGATLTDAVRFYLANAPLPGRKTFNELLPTYLRTKTNPVYRRAQQISLEKFGERFGTKPVIAIRHEAIEAWFDEQGWKPLNRRNYMRDCSMFFRWAKMRLHIAENPFERLTRPRVELSEPEIFTVQETARILEVAPEFDLLPMYAVGLFSGVRIEEIGRLTWEMFDWDQKVIRMLGTITKTGKPRMPVIMPVLEAALDGYKERTGLLVDQKNLRKRREALLKKAGVESKRNALRHSFASYHAAKFRDVSALQLLLGQKTPSVLFDHYVTATLEKDAENYFNLAPPYIQTAEGEAAPRL